MTSHTEELEAGLTHHQAGRLSAAESVYRSILSDQPQHPDALHLLGLVAHQVGKHELAVQLMTRAIEANPNVASFYSNCGEAHRALDNLDLAVSHYEKALAINPEYAVAHYNLGNAQTDLGRTDAAISSYEKALAIDPKYAEAHNNLGTLLQQLGRTGEAAARYERALAINPGFAEALNNLGNVLAELQRQEEAAAWYEKALAADPEYAAALNNLGNALKHLGRPVEAIARYEQALAIEPDFPEAHNNLGMALRESLRYDEAIVHYEKALALKDGFADAHANLGNVLLELGRTAEASSQYEKAENTTGRLGRCVAQIPIIYKDTAQIEDSRRRYARELTTLIHTTPLEAQADIDDASSAIGNTQPFYLTYQNRNDHDLQKTYGDWVCEIQARRYPAWAQRLSMPPCQPGEPLRVGIASAFFHYHSNWKMRIKGWLAGLDRSRFSLYGYYTGRQRDDETAHAERSFDRFVENSYSLEKLCQTILDDRLHILVFPGIGMDAMTLRLASLRLAPIQCTSWGHPQTSGLPTIDYFLSSDLMEPVGADAHYTEELVRLPNLSVFYEPPAMDSANTERAEFSLGKDSVLYFSPQSLFKYLPQYDDVFPRIAASVSNCEFVFILNRSPHVNREFLERMDQAFASYGLDYRNFAVFLQPLERASYHAVTRLTDVFLDSIGWSGCNSTLEAIECDLPVVTLPGELMRGRHSYAFLTMMGVTETIARDIDDYVSAAVRLGTDVEWRRHISDRIAANKHRVYRDMACIEALESFMEQAVSRHGKI